MWGIESIVKDASCVTHFLIISRSLIVSLEQLKKKFDKLNFFCQYNVSNIQKLYCLVLIHFTCNVSQAEISNVSANANTIANRGFGSSRLDELILTAP